MASGLELVRVRRGRGRIHLTAAVQAGRPVHTLCDRELTEVEVTDAEADCHLCVRRQHDPALVSSAFFNEEEGSRLLELSLRAARRRREGRPDLTVLPGRQRAAAPPSPPARTPPAPPPPERRGELHLAGLRRFSDDVYTTPGGVVVRMEGERIAEVTGGAGSRLRRTADGLRLEVGDLVVEERGGRLEARLGQ